MSAIIIAPVDNLPHASEEIESILVSLQKNYKVTLLQTEVTEVKLIREVNLGRQFPLVWVASHSDENGIALSNGEFITTSNFSRWLVNVDCRTLVLNSCFSAQLVTEIQNYANVEVIANIAPEGILDKDAANNASFLAENLVKTASTQLAVQRATGNGASQFRFFPRPREDKNTDTSTILDLLHKQDRSIEEIKRDLYRVETALDPIIRIVRGDTDLNVPSLMDQIRQIQTKEKRNTIIEINLGQIAGIFGLLILSVTIVVIILKML